MEKSKIKNQLIVGLTTTMAGLCSGFHLGWASPSLPKLLAKDADIPMTSDQSSWIVSVFSFGIAFGGIIGALLSDKCGRKFSLLLTAIPNLCSCLLIAAAQDFWWFIIARSIAGFGLGMTYAITPMYLGEVAEDRIRGALGTMLGFMVNAGILLAYCVGPWVSPVAFVAFGAAMPLIFALTFIWMPESPYFLIMKEKSDQAEKSLLWLKNKTCVKQDLIELQANINSNRNNVSSLRELLMTPGNRKALIIVLGLMAAQQFSGITAILSYSSLIFEASGSNFNADISVIIIGATQLLSGVLTTFTVDIAGRRPLLLLSGGSLVLFLGGEALYFQLQATGMDVDFISWVPVTAIIGFMIFFTIGFGALPSIIVSEIFPYNVKAVASMNIAVVDSGSAFAVSKLFQVVTDRFGIHTSFWGFAVITTFSLIFIHLMVPETKQRSLQSIQDELHKTTESTTKLEKSEQSQVA